MDYFKIICPNKFLSDKSPELFEKINKLPAERRNIHLTDLCEHLELDFPDGMLLDSFLDDLGKVLHVTHGTVWHNTLFGGFYKHDEKSPYLIEGNKYFLRVNSVHSDTASAVLSEANNLLSSGIYFPLKPKD